MGALTFFSILFRPRPNYENLENVTTDDFDFLDSETESAGGSSTFDDANTDFDSFDSTFTSGKASQNSAGQSTPSSQTLHKIIRNPETGVTYYLDEKVNKYYYVDPETNQTVYYSS